MNLWKCCNKNYSPGVTKCRKCGRERPVYGVIDESSAQDHCRKVRPKVAEKREHTTRDPLISEDDSKLFVSTLKMKDE
jgi:hypothetical protein